MQATVSPLALRERLGDEGVVALEKLMDMSHERVLSIAQERWERRLAEECGRLRVDMAAMEGRLQGDLHQLRTDVKGEVAHATAELMKWTLLVSISQTAIVAAIVALR